MFYRIRKWLYRLDLKRRGAVLPHSINGLNYVFGNIKGLRSGHHTLVEPGVRLNIGGEGANLSLGSYVYINSYTIIDCHYRVSIGNRVQIGPHCYIGDFDHDIRVDISQPHHRNNKKYAAVLIGDNVWIGAGAIILKGVTVGKNTVIAAGSVVTGDIPANVVAAGSPAKVVKVVEGNFDEETGAYT